MKEVYVVFRGDAAYDPDNPEAQATIVGVFEDVDQARRAIRFLQDSLYDESIFIGFPVDIGTVIVASNRRARSVPRYMWDKEEWLHERT